MRRLFLFLGLAALPLRADVTFAPVFTDHAVLQRDKPVPVWGRADAGEHVTVNFAGQSVSTTTDASGKWFVVLSSLQASSTPAELTAVGKNTARIQDVLVGDVWLCSGQSNMEFTVDRGLNAEQEIAAADHPLIRHLKVKRASTETPVDTAEGQWEVCSPQTVPHFTAVGYFFARDLQPRLNVPIGLINSTWGGTQIELWLSPSALVSNPAFASVAENWKRMQAEYLPKHAEFEKAYPAWKAAQAEAKARGVKFTEPMPPDGPSNGPQMPPSSLFNGMINPLLPCALRGILWYQGESNWYNPGEYNAMFVALIRSWRQHFGQGDLPFYWVQLPNYKNNNETYDTLWARLREAQTKALALPNTAQAITIDIGDPNDIHPKNKQEVGRRLALIARAKLFGAQVDASGPIFASATQEGKALRVRFTHAGTGLTAHDRPPQSFQVAGADRKFYPALAHIERDTVVVSAPQVPMPVAVRYAWYNAPDANLYNGAGLPAAPFRSDDW